MDEHEEKIFSISVEWVQLESERLIKRRLTDDELYSVKKGIEWGLLTDIDTVFKAAIEEAVSQHSWSVAMFNHAIGFDDKKDMTDKENFGIKRMTKEFIRFLLQHGAPK